MRQGSSGLVLARPLPLRPPHFCHFAAPAFGSTCRARLAMRAAQQSTDRPQLTTLRGMSMCRQSRAEGRQFPPRRVSEHVSPSGLFQGLSTGRKRWRCPQLGFAFTVVRLIATATVIAVCSSLLEASPACVRKSAVTASSLRWTGFTFLQTLPLETGCTTLSASSGLLTSPSTGPRRSPGLCGVCWGLSASCDRQPR